MTLLRLMEGFTFHCSGTILLLLAIFPPSRPPELLLLPAIFPPSCLPELPLLPAIFPPSFPPWVFQRRRCIYLFAECLEFVLGFRWPAECLVLGYIREKDRSVCQRKGSFERPVCSFQSSQHWPAHRIRIEASESPFIFEEHSLALNCFCCKHCKCWIDDHHSKFYLLPF